MSETARRESWEGKDEAIYAYESVGDKESSADEAETLAIEDFSDNQSYYQRNREKKRAYNREYSAQVRADAEKRAQINAQKRELMRRLLAKRRQERVLDAPVLREPKPSEVKNVKAMKRRQPRDHKQYYADHLDAMRESNRRYRLRVSSDPEKRAALNEKKKLAMRRMKERRRLEAEAKLNSLEYSDSQIIETESTMDRCSSLVDSSSCYEEDQTTQGSVYYPEILIEDKNGVENGEVIVEVEIEDNPEEHEVIVEPSEIIEEERIEDESSEIIFPFTMHAYRTIADDEERIKFVAYIEQCAQDYFK